jgi:hypothetical protein
MAIAILIGLLVLLVAGFVIAILAAKHAQRELEDLEEEFAEHRGVPHDDSDTPPPWSPIDLDALRDDVTDVTGPDPYATLTGMESAVTWNAASSYRLEPEPNGFDPEPNGFEPEPNGSPATTDLAPINDLRPVAWRASADAPIVVLVVGAGFLGTGMTTGVMTTDRLRRAWGEMAASFAGTGVITLNPDPGPVAPSHSDNGSKHEDVSGVDTATWPRPRRRRVDPVPAREDEPVQTSSTRAERRRADGFAPLEEDPSWVGSPRAERRLPDAFPTPDEEFSRLSHPRAERPRADAFPVPDEEFSRISSPRAERRPTDAFPPPEEETARVSARRAERPRADAFPTPDEEFSRITSPRARRPRADSPAPDEEFSRISSPRPRRRRADVLFPRPEDDTRTTSPPPRPRRSRPRPTADPEPITWRPPPNRR